MQPSQRRDVVMEQINRNGKVEIEALSRKLQVSPMTIRRDLAQLEEEGNVIRIHGGAILSKPLINETPFSTKESQKREQKMQIAKKALPFIKDGQTILLDSGTTTLEIARLLKTKENISVITNDIKIAAELVDSKLKVIVTGGELQNDVGALYGPITHRLLQNIHVNTFFLGAHAVDITAGVTSPTFEKSLIKQLMIDVAESTWIVTDSSKMNQKAFSKVCSLSELTGLITEDDISNEIKAAFSDYIEIL